ncbi:AbrB/MazE/SpoVT family DNA-binding domain-containing protein [Methylohalobius crimeensis]|uniref:AbrB/MazE/SpoVT family DNA-binding domain-containing protein n=1 Tax=Methylohalobius crimeensis TaxID=244365 RepID=UPI0003B42454|nr:type II toxin-antitoxin system PrlF family antitoxin [Methylohalobius crimeensis]
MPNVVKVTVKGQTTIPVDIRKALGIEPGDRIVWELDENGSAKIRKVPPMDVEYLKAVQATLSEWRSDTDEEAYRDL